MTNLAAGKSEHLDVGIEALKKERDELSIEKLAMQDRITELETSLRLLRERLEREAEHSSSMAQELKRANEWMESDRALERERCAMISELARDIAIKHGMEEGRLVAERIVGAIRALRGEP
jgi:hypothetical protein